jgi:hypothetical protein
LPFAVASFFPLSNITDDVGRSLGPFVSPQVLELIQEQMRPLANNENGGVLTFGVAGALWSSSAALASIVGALLIGARAAGIGVVTPVGLPKQHTRHDDPSLKPSVRDLLSDWSGSSLRRHVEGRQEAPRRALHRVGRLAFEIDQEGSIQQDGAVHGSFCASLSPA